MKKLSEVSKRTWCVSGLLIILSVIFVVYGAVNNGQYEWIWIIICAVAAVVNIVAELRLAPTTNAEEAERWRQLAEQNDPEPEEAADAVHAEDREEFGEAEDGDEAGQEKTDF